MRPLDPWPHSEAGRFHRVIALMLVALAALVLIVGAGAQPRADEAAVLAGAARVCVIWRRCCCDLRAHPANFPEPTPSHGLRMTGS